MNTIMVTSVRILPRNIAAFIVRKISENRYIGPNLCELL